ncbi:MAG: hypothetical protein GC134_09780 [Proteobacteria bacterium]|nr:hypothetical protein [Pseudomonadota bacterium]
MSGTQGVALDYLTEEEAAAWSAHEEFAALAETFLRRYHLTPAFFATRLEPVRAKPLQDMPDASLIVFIDLAVSAIHELHLTLDELDGRSRDKILRDGFEGKLMAALRTGQLFDHIARAHAQLVKEAEELAAAQAQRRAPTQEGE